MNYQYAWDTPGWTAQHMNETIDAGTAIPPDMPDGFVFVTVTGNYLDYNGLALSGLVRISTVPTGVIDDTTVLLPREILGKVTNGLLSVDVPASDNVTPPWLFTFKESFPGGRQFQAYVNKDMAPTVDITTLTIVVPPTTVVEPS